MIGLLFGGVALLINTLTWFFWVGTGKNPDVPPSAYAVVGIIYVLGGIVPFYLGRLTKNNFGGGAGAIELPAYGVTILLGSMTVFRLFQLF